MAKWFKLSIQFINQKSISCPTETGLYNSIYNLTEYIFWVDHEYSLVDFFFFNYRKYIRECERAHYNDFLFLKNNS